MEGSETIVVISINTINFVNVETNPAKRVFLADFFERDGPSKGMFSHILPSLTIHKQTASSIALGGACS